jgi:outer membrane biosynthesis protein TonB
MRPDIAASAIAHLSVLGLVIFFTEVRPFGSVTAEPIAVDIVAADQLEKAEAKPDQATQLPNTDSLTKEDAAAGLEKPAAPTPSASPQKTIAAEPQRETDTQKTRREAALQPKPQASPQPQIQPPLPQQQPQSPPQQQPQQPQSPLPQTQSQPLPQTPPQTQSQPPPAATSSARGYVPAAPDVTVKYHVLLGLPPVLPPAQASSSADSPGDGIDATASQKADLASGLIAEFRRHLKTCSKLPASLSPSDNVHVRLRVMMRPDGTLAAEPILIEGTASMKALELKQSAVGALMACQPYAMLPPDRYREWRVLDLSFTPDDFAS